LNRPPPIFNTFIRILNRRECEDWRSRADADADADADAEGKSNAAIILALRSSFGQPRHDKNKVMKQETNV
jgi:hypothetical protein